MVMFLGPFSRMVVTPENRLRRAFLADWMVRISSSRAARSSPLRPSPKPLLWVWQSTIPGSIVALG